MSVAVDRFIERLKDRRCDPKRNGQGWQARCPAHDDDRPSLSVHAGDDGRVLLNCHAGCGFADVLTALDLETRDLFPDNGQARGKAIVPARKIVAEYDYMDELGKLLFQVVRFEPKDFRQRQPDGKGGWIWNLRGVRRVLYRLPELLKADPSSTVFICEGEKDVDRLRSHGLIATCCAGGAAKWKHVDDEPLHGRHVVVIPDNDRPGIRHPQQVAASLDGKAASVKVLAPLVEIEHGDVSDFLDDGGDAEDLDRLATEAPEWKPGPPPTRPAYRNDVASLAAVRLMKKTATDARSAMMTLADQTAEWFDRRGPETLGKDYPVAYAAAVVGVSRCHFHRLAQIGRVRGLLSGQVLRSAQQLDDLSDRAITPLTKLMPERQDDVPAAFERACELASNEGKAVSSRHTTQAVAAILPGNPLADQPDPLQTLRKKIAALIDLARSIGAPPGVAVGLTAANAAAHDARPTDCATFSYT